MAFKIDEIINQVSKVEYYEIPVSKQDIVFLYRNNAITAAKALNAVLIESEDSDLQHIKLQKKYGLTVLEDAGMRGDRYSQSRRLELTAEIGRELGCNEVEANEILIDDMKWGKLSTSLKQQISLWMSSVLAESNDSSIAARRVTTLIQQRLIPSWQLEWTLLLSANLQSHFLEFVAGENAKWPKPTVLSLMPSDEDDDAIDVEVTEEKIGSPATNGKRSKSVVVV